MGAGDERGEVGARSPPADLAADARQGRQAEVGALDTVPDSPSSRAVCRSTSSWAAVRGGSGGSASAAIVPTARAAADHGGHRGAGHQPAQRRDAVLKTLMGYILRSRSQL